MKKIALSVFNIHIGNMTKIKGMPNFVRVFLANARHEEINLLKIR